MPQYYFECVSCDKIWRQILTPAQAGGEVRCRTCKSIIQRVIVKTPSVSVVERLDNGLMPKAVERPADAERLYAERARQATEDAKKNV